jgi:hypothetical protein
VISARERDFVKDRFSIFLSFRRKPESSKFNRFWMPDQVRHDDWRTFYEFVNVKKITIMAGSKKMKCKPIIAALAICAVLLACEPKGPESIPPEMLGVWETSAPKYEGCYFELTKDKVSFANKAYLESFVIHKISKIEIVTPKVEKLLCTVYYTDSEGQEYEFSFYYDPSDGGSIRFKNQTTIKWVKADAPSIEEILTKSG